MSSDRRRHGLIGLVTIGALIAIIVACNPDRRLVSDAGELLTDAGRMLSDAAGDSAMAQPSCTNWEVTKTGPHAFSTGVVNPGWEPFAAGSDFVYWRRCP